MNGTRLRLSREQVIDRLRSVRPEPIQTWAVEVDGRLFPVKQALSEATGASRSDFISHRARDLLRRLGFSVQEMDQEPLPPSAAPGNDPIASHPAAHGEMDARLAALRAAIDFYRDKPAATPADVADAARTFEGFLAASPDRHAASDGG